MASAPLIFIIPRCVSVRPFIRGLFPVAAGILCESFKLTENHLAG